MRSSPGYSIAGTHLLREIMMTEKELIRGVIRKDREALSFLVDKYQRSIIKTAYYFLGNMEDAEDLAQDIFLNIVNSIGKFRNSSSLSTWIYRMSVNSSINAYRRKKRQNMFLSMESLFIKRSFSQDASISNAGYDESPVNREEDIKQVQKAIANLPANQRTAFILCKYEELSYKEIAEVMEISISSVESLLHRAKKNLQKSLAQHFSEYSNKKEI